MTNLASFSLLRERVIKHQTDNGIDDPGLAFDWLVPEVILGLDTDEIEAAITDGSMDGGIDAVHITGRTVHIFNNKYTTDFEHTKRRFPETGTSGSRSTTACWEQR